MPLLPHSSKSRRGDTVWLANAGVQKGSGLAINDGFTVQYAHVAGGGGVKRKIVDGRVERMGGWTVNRPVLPYGARWRWRRRPSMHFFNGGAGRGALAMCHQGPPHAAEQGDRTAATGRRRDGGTEGILVHDFTREQGCQGCRRQSQSSSRQALFSTTLMAPPSVRRCRCLSDSVPVSTRWVPWGDGASARRSRCDDAVLRKPRCGAPP